MKHSTFYIAIVSVVSIALIGFACWHNTPLYFEVPKSFPKPVYDFQKNPLTEEGFQLGRNLFYDPILSKDNTISCASCHLQQTGFAHVDHQLSHGIDGKIGTRNALTIQNLAWAKNFMWDGGVNHLEVQPVNPITNASEMNETLANVVVKLQQSEKYRALFEAAFGPQKITGQLTLKALAQFVVMLKTSNSKYDHVINGTEKFTDVEQKGYALFRQNCASCHQEPLFTNDKFENNGLTPDSTLNDIGRMRITQKSADYLKFKVPTLRNIQFTFPYMHDGRFKTLNEVVNHYNSGVLQQKTLSAKLKKPLHLSDNERTEIVAFLKTLTDREFLFNPALGYPRN
ncbi:MAG: cytochrome-c peroxidase [Flavobacterium sp. BFFFF1]|uniref:cytochrome-c peroxidase n=1 Tax=Flavobacterium sp. BFFFF1 TaxID=2015557 RepID=UPI000BCDAEF2|nr:cytochrome c peroxidase [Flavobacterium sp. BFFFF1]OYU79637.1 MAG: cytochrome-c peroxidase [Flavobacterium sp. BFFFF1]